MATSTYRAAWVTDIHLNFVWDQERGQYDSEYDEFVEAILASKAQAVLIGGDIAEGPELLWHLDQLAERLVGQQLFFVLGNHDFYRSSIFTIRRDVRHHCQGRRTLTYLTAAKEPLTLAPGVGLIGHDGWADGRFGELEWSRAKISDYAFIEELITAGEDGRRAILNALGDEAAAHLRTQLLLAVDRFPEIVLLTHVPPWLEASRYRGQLADYEYAPHFASKAIGEAIEEVMRDSQQCQLTVICGHTHERATHQPLKNVRCLVGKAEYGTPAVEQVFEFESDGSAP
jgi:Icc-related predicted phosphoesterase